MNAVRGLMRDSGLSGFNGSCFPGSKAMLVFYRFQKATLEIEGCLAQSPVKTSAGLGGVSAWRSHLLASCLLLLQSYWCSGMAEPLPCQLLQAASLDPKLSFSTGFKKRR
jgi:hypothetical protein